MVANVCLEHLPHAFSNKLPNTYKQTRENGEKKQAAIVCISLFTKNRSANTIPMFIKKRFQAACSVFWWVHDKSKVWLSHATQCHCHCHCVKSWAFQVVVGLGSQRRMPWTILWEKVFNYFRPSHPYIFSLSLFFLSHSLHFIFSAWLFPWREYSEWFLALR